MFYICCDSTCVAINMSNVFCTWGKHRVDYILWLKQLFQWFISAQIKLIQLYKIQLPFENFISHDISQVASIVDFIPEVIFQIYGT